MAREAEAWITGNLPHDYPWPGNIRELEQCVRNVLVRREYRPRSRSTENRPPWLAAAEAGTLSADQLLAAYATWVHAKNSTPSAEVVEAIEFVNVDSTTIVQKELERKTIPVANGSEIYVNYRTVAFFHFDPDFHHYPFDAHTLPIVVEHETLQADDLEFVDDVESYGESVRESGLWGLGGDVSLPDFTLTSATRQVSSHRYDTNFGDPTLQQPGKSVSFDCSRMTLGIGIKRVLPPQQNLWVNSGSGKCPSPKPSDL